MNALNSIVRSRVCAAGAMLFVIATSAHGGPTPTAEVTEGPFYPFNSSNRLPPIAPANRDNDLTRLSDTSQPAKGLPFLLSGTVRDLNGTPVEGAKVELWQTDDGGVYYHSGDDKVAKRDANFQFYGESVTDQSGAYSFRTVKPGLYSGRVRHFHFKVKLSGETVLTSQFTFEDERADFARDGVQRRLSGASLDSTVIAPEKGADPTGASAWIAKKDIVIDPNARSSTGAGQGPGSGRGKRKGSG